MIVLEPARIRAWQSRQHRAAALAFATDRAPPGAWVECGVADGWSARYLLERLPQSGHLHLLDSFECLEHEGRAIRDWQRESGRRLTPIARTRYTQLVTEVTR